MAHEAGFKTRTRPLSVALMLVVFLAAMETTITTLATPSITRDLAGFDLMSLIFSSYLFMSAITTPVFGKLADMFGRKRMLIAGIIVFLIGCVMCGLSQTMTTLIVSRAIQGIGAGSIFTLSYTIVGDVYPLESRGPIMGALSSVWGIAGLAGPLLGGLLIDYLSWHWVFYINIPFGILSIVLVQISHKEKHSSPSGRRQRADRSGLFTRMTVLVNAVAFLACVVMMGIDVYVALFLQTVLGYSPTIAGLAVFPMSISWFVVSVFMGKLLMRFNARLIILISGFLQLVCGALLISLDESSGLLLVIFSVFIGGLGLGGLFTATTILIQESVGYSKRGTAMGINSFVKSMGQTVGISVLGALLNVQLASFFTERGYFGVDPSTLLQQGDTAGSTASSVTSAASSGSGVSSELSADIIVTALDSGIDFLFWIMLACTVLLVIIALFIPNIRLGESTLHEQNSSSPSPDALSSKKVDDGLQKEPDIDNPSPTG